MDAMPTAAAVAKLAKGFLVFVASKCGLAMAARRIDCRRLEVPLCVSNAAAHCGVGWVVKMFVLPCIVVVVVVVVVVAKFRGTNAIAHCVNDIITATNSGLQWKTLYRDDIVYTEVVVGVYRPKNFCSSSLCDGNLLHHP
jgi:hypothetical protein